VVNRLQQSQSPYLLQHADNPVDWWPWSEEAFEQARERDVPVFLSVGYAACHWCHVMAHESFEDDNIARYLNEHFVSIKVDREERPDVDAIYMDATQAMTGQGGWPMSAFLTPDGAPFFCGTYFPPSQRGGMPGFPDVLQAIVEAWEQRRDGLAAFAVDTVGKLGGRRVVADGAYDGAVLASAARKLAIDADPINGGFGGAPKFPPSMVLDFLLRHYRRSSDEQSLELVKQTCAQMASGGMYDQIGGGFARYSVDATWTVPHFEKMLYDNALLLDVYTQLWAVTADPATGRIAEETADFVLRVLCTAEGGFAASLDADTEGQEGLFYVWTPGQLVEVLGEQDGRWVAGLCGVTDEGTFEDGRSVLQMRELSDDLSRWRRVRRTLREARDRRARPERDDKVVAAWNGLAVTALIRAGVLFERDDLVEAALRCARMLRDVHVDDAGRLRRTSRDGLAGDTRGVLDDYGAVALAYLTVLAVDADPAWLEAARQLLDRVLADFTADGEFFDVDAQTAERLVWRPYDPTDNASPSGVSLAAEALVTFAAVTGEHRYREAAERALAGTVSIGTQVPRFAGRALAVAELTLSGPAEIAIVGESPELRRAAVAAAAWGTPVVAGPSGTEIPLMHGRTLVDGKPAAYVCRNFACQIPATDPSDFTVAQMFDA
jgi:hypothetical protein